MNAFGDLARRASIRWAAAGLVLLVGYAFLWRGSISLAPLLLVIGYCVLIPLAILALPGVAAGQGK